MIDLETRTFVLNAIKKAEREIDKEIAEIQPGPGPEPQETFIYRGTMRNSGLLMINGKAPAGSSIDDAVWTVVYHYLNSAGEITGEDTFSNVRWSDI